MWKYRACVCACFERVCVYVWIACVQLQSALLLSLSKSSIRRRRLPLLFLLDLCTSQFPCSKQTRPCPPYLNQSGTPLCLYGSIMQNNSQNIYTSQLISLVLWLVAVTSANRLVTYAICPIPTSIPYVYSYWTRQTSRNQPYPLPKDTGLPMPDV